jgi:hypothetical protein
MTNKINTFDTLGRFLIDQTYNILLDTKNCKINYAELKRLLQRRIDRNPNIDKRFAMHKYNHGKSTLYVSNYRWENVLYYYINQHQKVLFLQRIYKSKTHYIKLMNSVLLLDNWHYDLDMSYMFDTAQKMDKMEEENLLHKSKTNKDKENYLNQRNILHRRQQEMQIWKKRTK